MPKARSTSSFTARQPRSSRSVAGCLTCRRRKVKCTSLVTPCEACQRLRLSCDPSFPQNFKNWSQDSKNDGRHVPEEAARGSPADAGSNDGHSRRTRTPATVEGVLYHEPSPVPQQLSKGHTERSATPGDATVEDAPVEGPFGLLDFIFSDLADEMTPVDFSTPANLDAFFSSDWAIQRPFVPGSCETDKDNPPSNALVHQTAVSTSAATSRVATEHAISRVFPDGALDPKTSQALSRVPELMSTKQSIYTCFHYLVHSAQAIPNSPLCHAILGWVYAYLARLSAETASSRDEHYTAASEGIRALVAELTAPHLPELWRRTNTSERLSSYLSATFFACQHDLMMEHFSSFVKRIGEAKVVFQHHWADRTLPGPVESRVVIWLAFLELRFYFLGGERYASTDGQKDFMTILDEETRALPTLRRARTQKSVLSEMFADNLPQEEDEEDLRKDRCRVQFDDFMCHLAKTRSFAAWDAMQARRRDADSPLLKELREAKVEALHANLRRLQAECELVIPSSKALPSSDRPVDSITFHMLTVRALRSCAVIVFKRVTDTSSRTDAECQAAVADIVRIARVLRQSKYLRSPRSTIWPLPLYIAGIETTDGIYQDWVLDYLKELSSWGAHMQLAVEGLERIISLQERTSFRAPLMMFEGINL